MRVTQMRAQLVEFFMAPHFGTPATTPYSRCRSGSENVRLLITPSAEDEGSRNPWSIVPTCKQSYADILAVSINNVCSKHLWTSTRSTSVMIVPQEWYDVFTQQVLLTKDMHDLHIPKRHTVLQYLALGVLCERIRVSTPHRWTRA